MLSSLITRFNSLGTSTTQNTQLSDEYKASKLQQQRTLINTLKPSVPLQDEYIADSTAQSNIAPP